ncbi:substrate-binding domain-containing protein [Paenibacillus lycopersici]|uniref:Substrate-binding domain-containing protein n=1 Tax=Paenibacillus lycopersici TaxID=2704462 RepID=A0A6C0FYA1_9BACL|nr:substrate-binding domain-containing protein [Paenibacillus lycopersici]QHT60234.1 substrate-binding domain-containing protein [Paenibacillus lycopersici]
MAGKLSMQQLADRLGVSKYTVSQALAGKPGVSEATRREVTALAGALGYAVKPSARTGKRKPAPEPAQIEAAAQPMQASPHPKLPVQPQPPAQHAPSHPSKPSQPRIQAGQGSPPAAAAPPSQVLFIGLDERHSQESSFWLRVREGLEAGCRLQGLRPFFFTYGPGGTNPPELEAGGLPEEAADAGPAARDAAGAPAGFIVAGNCPLDMLLRLKRLGLPIVLADNEEPLIGADAVLNANAEAGRMACRHLLSQGCRRIAFIGRDSFAVSFRERWWGCRQSLDDVKEPGGARHSGSAGMPPVQLKKWTVPYGSTAMAVCQAAMERKLDAALAEGLPDGFVCANDDLAIHLLEVLQGRGLADHARVVGIDNTAAAMSAAVPLTTVDLAKETLGIRAVEAFARKLRQPEAQPEKIILSARLIVRHSG